MKAVWNNKIIAESDKTIIIEGNHYFPLESVKKEYLKDSETKYQCPWKGQASYHNIVVDGEENKDAAWYYPEPSEMAEQIKNHIAFGNGIEVSE